MRAPLLALAVLLAAASPAAAAVRPLERHAPVVIPDSGEADLLAEGLHGRRAGPWLQYWMTFEGGGRQLVQYRVSRGRIVEAVYAQHEGAERCGAAALRRRAGRPAVFLARDSHAAYFARGLRDRIWPAPNDEADGRGVAVHPRVIRRSGEPGPAAGRRWTDPDGWAADAGECRARRCNERGECDLPETLMAAGAAGLGLLAALGLAGRRLRRV